MPSLYGAHWLGRCGVVCVLNKRAAQAAGKEHAAIQEGGICHANLGSVCVVLCFEPNLVGP